MNNKNILRIYSKNGKEMFPTNGMIISQGSIVLTSKNEFIVLDQEYVYQKNTAWNNLCQSKDTTINLIPVKE